MEQLSAFVFDLDGTLIDSTETLLEGLSYTLSPWSIEVSEKLIEDIRGSTAQELFSHFNFTQEEQRLAFERLNFFFKNNFHQINLFPGIEELLQILQASGIRIALWTARDTASAELILNAKGIAHYFEYIMGHTGLEKNKPHSDGLDLLLNKMNIPANQVIMIGDHDHDIIGGKSSGCHTARVWWGETAVIPTVEAEYNFQKVEELIQFVKKEIIK